MEREKYLVTPDNALYNVDMKHAKHMTDIDRAELAAIDVTVSDARKSRRRVLTRIRQRAYRAASTEMRKGD